MQWLWGQKGSETTCNWNMFCEYKWIDLVIYLFIPQDPKKVSSIFSVSCLEILMDKNYLLSSIIFFPLLSSSKEICNMCDVFSPVHIDKWPKIMHFGFLRAFLCILAVNHVLQQVLFLQGWSAWKLSERLIKDSSHHNPQV